MRLSKRRRMAWSSAEGRLVAARMSTRASGLLLTPCACCGGVGQARRGAVLSWACWSRRALGLGEHALHCQGARVAGVALHFKKATPPAHTAVVSQPPPHLHLNHELRLDAPRRLALVVPSLAAQRVHLRGAGAAPGRRLVSQARPCGPKAGACAMPRTCALSTPLRHQLTWEDTSQHANTPAPMLRRAHNTARG